MAQSTMTFEELDKQLRAVDEKAFAPGGNMHLKSATAIANPLPNICAIYKQIIRPVLSMILLTPFIPQAWKDKIKVAIAFMDGICP